MSRQVKLTLRDLILQCLKMHSDNKSREAIDILYEVNRKHPRQAPVHDVLATIYCDLGEFDQAIQIAKARTLIHADANAYKNLGICYEKAGKLTEAAQHLTKSLTLQSSQTLAERLVRIKISNHEFTKLDELQHFINHYQIKESLYRLLEFLLHKLMYDWVISITKDELSLNGVNLSLELILVKALLHTDSEECISRCHKILSEHDSPLAETILAMAYTARGDHEKGLASLSALRDRFPKDEAIKINYSQALLKAGQFKLGYENYAPMESNRSPFNLPFILPETKERFEHTLICMDQGVGDQLRHSLFLKMLLDHDLHSHVIVDPRLIPLLQLVAPGHKYYGRASDVPKRILHQQCYGSQLGANFYPALSKPSDDIIQGWMSQIISKSTEHILAPSNRPYLGVAWRSAKLIAGRESWFPDIDFIANVIKGADVHLVALNSQLSKEEQRRLNELPLPCTTVDELGIDAMNDFLAMANLINQLDVCLLPATAIAEQAAALAKPTIFLGAEGADRWSVSKNYRKAFHPNISYFGKKDEENWHNQQTEIRQTLKALLASK